MDPKETDLEETPQVTALLDRIRAGDASAVGELLESHRPPLVTTARIRMDRRLLGRVDPADIVQEAYLEASQRIDRYVADPDMPFRLWLRFLTLQCLATQHRRHLGTQKRDAARDVSLRSAPLPAHSHSIALELTGNFPTPSEEAMRVEIRTQLEDALDSLEPIDREVLCLRHFEELSNDEVAHLLDLSKAAASNRYVRALRRLKELLNQFPDFASLFQR